MVIFASIVPMDLRFLNPMAAYLEARQVPIPRVVKKFCSGKMKCKKIAGRY
jgi:hypothetical protein